MFDNIPYFVHVGLPRTASLWLQKLFSQHPEICYKFRTKFFECNDNYKRGINYYEVLFDIKSDHKVVLDSNESYSIGRLIRSTGWSVEKLNESNHEDIAAYILKSDIKYLTKRIKDTVPSAKIIIVLRRQDEWLLSAYRQYVGNEGKSWLFDDFLNSNYGGKDLLQAGYFYNVVKNYFDYFEEKNVLVLFFEELVESKELFLEKITNFMGVSKFRYDNNEKPMRKSMSNRGVVLMRYANIVTQKLTKKRSSFYYRFVRRGIWLLDNVIFSKLKKRDIISTKRNEEIINMYKKDNKKLSSLLNVDLRKWNYY